MKKIIQFPIGIFLLLYPGFNFAQAPNLGTAANFVLFSTTGAIGNTGISHITGNVGTNTGAITSFSNIDGVVHSPDGATAVCATDLQNAYSQLNAAIPTFFPGVLLGNGTTLSAGVYSIPAAASVNNMLILDGKGNENAVFIFQVDGAFSSGAGAEIKLINCAKACNVFWKVEGAVSLAAGTIMKGTIIANNAAISLGSGVILEGRALSTTGAVAVNNVLAFLPPGIGSPLLTGPVPPVLSSAACYTLFSSSGLVTNTGTTTVSGNIGTDFGQVTGFNPLLVNGSIHTVPDGSTSACASDLLNTYNYLNSLPYDIELLYPAQFGNSLVLTPHTYLMNGAATFTDTLFLNAQGNANAVFVIRTMGPIVTSINAQVVLLNGAQARNVYWQVEGAVTINDNSDFKGTIVCNNGAVVLNTGTLLEGRAFTTSGALTTTAVTASVVSAASISYAGYTYCSNGGIASVTFSGITGGVFSSSAGLIIDSATGAVNLGLSTAGNYVVTYSIIAAGECLASSASAGISISVAPSAIISYPGSPFCSNTGSTAVAFSGTTSGTYSSIPAGLSLDPLTGIVDLAASIPGAYTVTYTITNCSGGCGTSNYTTNTVIVINPYTWTGGVSTDWNTTGNWAGNAVPTTACADVTILSGVPYQPTLSSGFATIQNIIINSGAILTVTNATMQLSGTISNSGTFDVSNGAIELNGSGTQTIPANAFQSDSLKDLIISNSSIGGVTLGGALDIYGSLTYTGTGMKLTTNDNLTIKSTSTNTAFVGDMTGNVITGKVTVERYLSAHRAWRFLSVPTNTSQTIKQSWQENQAANNTTLVGLGTQISSNRATWSADGFDFYSAGGPTMKIYNSLTSAWDGITGTGIGIKATDGYMTFVRGDRTANGAGSTATQTVVRTQGDLYTGDQPPIPVGSLKFAAIGNPYASALDMRYVTKTGINNFFYVWDPYLGGNYGLGGYQTFSYNGSDYIITPGGASYGAGDTVSNYIQSGLAFLVQAKAGGGSVTFKEDAKTSGSAQVSRPVKLSHSPVSSATGLLQSKLRTNLYGFYADNSTYILDGTLNNYRDDYSNNVDSMNAIKLMNPGENLSIKRTNQLLVIERRHTITQNDTIFLNLTNTKVQKYHFEFIAANFNQPRLITYLEDSYLNTKTLLNPDGTTTADFSIINIPGSYAANRFRIVFTQAGILPLTMTSLKAYQVNKNIAVEWATANESNMKQYEVEKSLDGNNYAKANTVKAKNAAVNAYSWMDAQPVTGYNYYRIKSIDLNGKIKYSEVVRVFIGTSKEEITIYPNPVTNNTINLQLVNQSAGNYQVKLLNNMGQQVLEKSIEHAEGSSTELIPVKQNISKGIYQLQVTKPDGSMVTTKLVF